MNLTAGVLHLLTYLLVRSLVLLHDTMFILGECFLLLAANSLFCCRRFGVRLSGIGYITKYFVWACYRSKLTVPHCRTVHVSVELIFIQFRYFSVLCFS